jgi:tetratricopeptide (TPR) repeat protein
MAIKVGRDEEPDEERLSHALADAGSLIIFGLPRAPTERAEIVTIPAEDASHPDSCPGCGDKPDSKMTLVLKRRGHGPYEVRIPYCRECTKLIASRRRHVFVRAAAASVLFVLLARISGALAAICAIDLLRSVYVGLSRRWHFGARFVGVSEDARIFDLAVDDRGHASMLRALNAEKMKTLLEAQAPSAEETEESAPPPDGAPPTEGEPAHALPETTRVRAPATGDVQVTGVVVTAATPGYGEIDLEDATVRQPLSEAQKALPDDLEDESKKPGRLRGPPPFEKLLSTPSKIERGAAKLAPPEIRTERTATIPEKPLPPTPSKIDRAPSMAERPALSPRSDRAGSMSERAASSARLPDRAPPPRPDLRGASSSERPAFSVSPERARSTSKRGPPPPPRPDTEDLAYQAGNTAPRGDDLSPAVKADIESRLARGEGLMRERRFVQALVELEGALDRVPKPVDLWQVATRIYSAMGEAYYQLGDFRETARCTRKALECPDGMGNPSLLLRSGQAQFELGDMERARQHLRSAYLGGGEALFANEDPKYLAVAK